MTEIAPWDMELIPSASLRSVGEVVPGGESDDIRATVALVETRLRQAAKDGPARRDAHAKGHGCVRAEFQILDDLPPEYQVGLFAQPRRYTALIRFSNGAGTMGPDRNGDSRGMAIKLVDVPASPSGTQDFVLVNHPVFVIRSVADYLELQSASPQWRFFLPGWNPFRIRLHELLITLAITRQVVRNPLDLRYWSMTAFLYDAGAAKFSAQPVGTPSSFQDVKAGDCLHRNLAAHLAAGGAAFDFQVQLRTRPDEMPVEDPTVEWQERHAPFRPVARITIPPQRLVDAEFCENLSFTPWHGLSAHRPLGGMNRVRREVYKAISRLRHELNATPRKEPTASDIA